MKEFIDNPGDPLAGIDEAVAALRAAWAGGDDGALLPASALKGSQLIAVNDALSVVSRLTSAIHSPVAAEIVRESRPELGATAWPSSRVSATPSRSSPRPPEPRPATRCGS